MTNKTKTILCVCALTASAFAWNATAASGIYEDTITYSDAAWFLDLRYGGIENEDLPAYRTAMGLGESDSIANIKQTSFTALVNDARLSISMEENLFINPVDPTDTFQPYTLEKFSFGTYTVSQENLTYNEKDHPILLDAEKGYKSLLFNSENPLFTTTTLDTVDSAEKAAEVLHKTYVTDPFSKGDLVGLWVKDLESQIVYYSDNTLTLHELPEGLTYSSATVDPYTAQYTEGFNEREPYGPATGDASVWFDTDLRHTRYSGDEFRGWPGQTALAQLKFHVEGVAPASDGNVSGGPLPGVWATIALAGAASAYLKRRRKENK